MIQERKNEIEFVVNLIEKLCRDTNISLEPMEVKDGLIIAEIKDLKNGKNML